MGGPADEQWVAQGVTVDGPTVRATLRPGLPAGQFTVGYRVVSADGHPITGSVAAGDVLDQPWFGFVVSLPVLGVDLRNVKAGREIRVKGHRAQELGLAH
ncbi:copper resistance CopC family protein, partial [Nocardia takedensis]|uniref:copper resistance CopC family protein n=1 Tax=Nocardia takedensis TaxID=259390 RepID=UPI0005934B55